MPSYLIPRKSGVHRAACFALTRALLQQVKHLPLPVQQQNTVSNQIKTVVKRNQQLQSPHEIAQALRLGYETLGALHYEEAWRPILTQILDLGVQRITEQRESNHKNIINEADQEAPSRANAGRPRVWPHPNGSKTLDRPYSALSGRRRVPKLINANRVPFLRLKKPQSPFVSRVIRNTIDTRERRITLSIKLGEQIPVAQDEDKWDDILFNQFRLRKDADRKGWAYEVRQSFNENHNLQVTAIQRRRDIAARMHSIVEKEEELAGEEKQRQQATRRRQIRLRRLARAEPKVSVTEESKTVSAIDGPSGEPTLETAVVPGTEQHKLISTIDIRSRDSMLDTAARDRSKFKTKEEIESIRAANAVSRTDEDVAAIKAARARRKEEEAQKKAERVKKKAQNTGTCQNDSGRLVSSTIIPSDNFITPARKPSKLFKADRLRRMAKFDAAKSNASLRTRPYSPKISGWLPSEPSGSEEQAKIQ